MLTAACPDEHRILAFVQGEPAEDVEAHIDACPACRALVSELARGSLVGGPGAPRTPSLSPTEPVASEPAGALAAGATVGRFVVEGVVGAGGMGVVYAARDPALGRKVALKLLRGGRGDDEETGGQARLMREAQAMAKLSHTNVIGVYEVGTYGGRVFVAMEYVDGGTLAEWLRSERREWREVLDLFLRAGRGLQAAHEGGLVHRDFKPDNVMRGSDGRVRVTDFGLARAPDRRGEAAAGAVDTDDTLTRTGALVGTPAYMAPEQHAGEQVDARSDQFSFCVALYEGLYGERPFRGRTVDELKEAVTAGRVNDPPADSRVPAWVRRLVVRGLAADPAARHPTMAHLLDALGRDPRARMTRIALLSAALLATIAGVALAYHRGGSAQVCAGAEQHWRGVWDAEHRETIRRAFLATKRPYAQGAWDTVAAGFDAYTAQWSAMRTEACVATRVRKEQPESVMALRMACLDRRRAELASLARVFENADGEVVDHAVEGAARLPDLQSCADTESLLAQTPLPRDPEVRARIERLRNVIDEAQGLWLSNRAGEALPGAATTAVAAQGIGYRPLEAEAMFLLAEVAYSLGNYPVTAQAFEAAAIAGEASRADSTAARGWISLLRFRANKGIDVDTLDHVDLLARSAVERAGGDDGLRARYLDAVSVVWHSRRNFQASLDASARALEIWTRLRGPESNAAADTLKDMADDYHEMGKLDLAEQTYRHSLAITEKLLGVDHPDTVAMRSSIASLYATQGRYEEAVAEFKKVLASQEVLLGPDHPALAPTLNNMAGTLMDLERWDEAKALLERAVAVTERTYGAANPRLAIVLGSLGNLYMSLGDTTKARAYAERALAIDEAALGPDHADVAQILSLLAAIDQLDARDADSIAHFQRALAIQEKVLGPRSPQVAVTLADLGALHLAEERYGAAAAAFERAVSIDEPVLGPDHPSVAYDLAGLGRAYLGMGRAPDAVKILERALAIRDKTGVGTVETAELQLALGQALWRTGGDRKRARKLVGEALATFEGDAEDPDSKNKAATARSWLRSPK